MWSDRQSYTHIDDTHRVLIVIKITDWDRIQHLEYCHILTWTWILTSCAFFLSSSNNFSLFLSCSSSLLTVPLCSFSMEVIFASYVVLQVLNSIVNFCTSFLLFSNSCFCCVNCSLNSVSFWVITKKGMFHSHMYKEVCMWKWRNKCLFFVLRSSFKSVYKYYQGFIHWGSPHTGQLLPSPPPTKKIWKNYTVHFPVVPSSQQLQIVHPYICVICYNITILV